MLFEYNLSIFIRIILLSQYPLVFGKGVLLLYRPKDVTNECAFSEKLRYDLSFGNGMSDTITVVLRNIPNIDYECQIDITTDAYNKIVVVIRFPNAIGYNCENNPSAFKVLKMNDCYPICSEEHLEYQNVFSKYWLLYTQGRFRFQFRSNSSINTDINAFLYEITVTTARLRPKNGFCHPINETECYAQKTNESYCITSGVLCDGIKNCGTEDWYDERRSTCADPRDPLDYAPIIAIVGIIFCALLAGIHLFRRCFPNATSFFVYNTNEDNQLRIDPLLKPPSGTSFEPSEYTRKKQSLVPIYLSDDSSGEEVEELDGPMCSDLTLDESEDIKNPNKKLIKIAAKLPSDKTRTMSERIQKRVFAVIGRAYNLKESGN